MPNTSDFGICFEPLEPRLLLSGSMEAGIDSPSPDSFQNAQTDLTQESVAIGEISNNLSLIGKRLGEDSVDRSKLVDILEQMPALHLFGSGNHDGEVAPSASDAGTVSEANGEDDAQANAEQQADRLDTAGRRELVFVDTGAHNYQQLVDDLLSDQSDDRQIEVILLDTDRDGVQQISDALAERQDLDAVHFVTHGTERSVKFGATWLNTNNLDGFSNQITEWKNSLTEGADLLFYGCELAAGQDGRALLDAFGSLTGADVAASVDDTGHSRFGADWDLEYTLGSIESTVAFSPALQQNWTGLLDTFTVFNTNDSGAGSFRQAIIDANADGVEDTIAFNIPDDDPSHFYYQNDGIAGSLSVIASTTSADAAILDFDPDYHGTPHSWFTISPTSVLPAITKPVIIDGYSQPGASVNTETIGSDAILRIELDGSNIPDNALIDENGLTLEGGGSTVKGLVINNFKIDGADAIELDEKNGNTITGNYIGTDVTGTIALGNDYGVNVKTRNNIIGGSSPASRNVISGNDNEGIYIYTATASDNTVSGNYIGVDATGLASLGNGDCGVTIKDGAQDNLIGGSDPGAGNVIAGNNFHGVLIQGVDDNRIQGNYIGLDATGNAEMGNARSGVSIEGDATGNIIGTDGDGVDDAAEGNVISGNDRYGIQITDDATGNIVAGNLIGTNTSGVAAVGNGWDGLAIAGDANNNLIGTDGDGTSDALERNVISGNVRNGIEILNTASDNIVAGNFIGTQIDGASPLGNGESGVQFKNSAVDNLIGGTAAGMGNIIAYNGLAGVEVDDGTNNAIRANAIFGNTGLGIDLIGGTEDGFGVTANDAGDSDTGVNNLQNYPIITSVVVTASDTTIDGTINSTAGTTFELDFFYGSAADPSGHGEAMIYLGSSTVTTNGSGNGSFSVVRGMALPAGSFVTATATDPDGNTSEFSLCVSEAGANAAPTVALSNAVTAISENTNTTLRTKFADITITDDGLGTNVLSLSGADAAMFEIDTGVLYLQAGAVLDHETNPVLDVTVEVNDATLAPDPNDTASLSTTVTDVNEPPTTSPVTLTAIAEDSGARTITQAELLANADDVENDALTATGLAISAGNGSLVDNGDGTWDYTPAADDDTSVSFSYSIDDGIASVAGSATLDITPVNDAPTTSAVALAAIAEDSGARTITQAELLANANDVENDSLTATGLAISAGSGSLVDNFDGTWDYTPAADDETSVSFSYSIDDGTASVAGSATLDITPVNDAPTVALFNTVNTLSENTDTTLRTKVADITVTDDSTGVNVLSLVGADAGLFQIDAGVLFLKAGAVLDHVTNGTLDVTVQVNDTALAPNPNDTASLSISITDASGPALGTLWFTTQGNGDAGGESWAGNELVLFGDAGDTFDIDGGLTNGTMSKLSGFISPGNIRGIHYVQTEITLGTTGAQFSLNPGDLIVALDETTTFHLGEANEFTADRRDIVVFKTATTGDYSNGQWSMLLEEGVQNSGTVYNVHAISLIEKNTTVGGQLLPRGTFLVSYSGPSLHNDIYSFSVIGTGSGVDTQTTDTQPFLLGDALGNTGDQIQGLHLLQQDTEFGSTTLSTGTLLVQVNNSDVFAGQAHDQYDIVALQVGATEATGGTTAIGSLFFQGTDISLDANNENINGFTIKPSILLNNEPPTVSLSNPVATLDEDTVTTPRIKVADITVGDDGLGTSVLSLAGADAGMFEIDGSELYLRADEVLDYETNPVLDVVVQVDDASVGSTPDATAALSIDIIDVNDAPTASNLNAAETYTEDTPLDLIDIAVDDVDSADVTVTLTLSDPNAGTLNIGTSGTVTSTYDAVAGQWTANGAIADVNVLLAGLTFTPSLNYNSDFTIATSVSDGVAPAVTGVKDMTGIPVNDAPTTSAVTLAEIAEDSGAHTITQAELLANANDVENDALTATGLAISAGSGSLVDNGDGTWDYTPAADDDASVSFSYSITDGTASVAGSASMDITAVNDAPTTSAVTLAAIAEDSGARTITQAELLANADDVENDALTATGLAISAGNGSLVDNGDGTWDYTTAVNDETSVSFSYNITDGTDNVAGSASMDITPVNDAPTTSAVTLTAIGEDGGARTITQAELLANANDVENDALTATGLAISTGSGNLVDNFDGTWDYTPAADDDTSVSFSYSISDGTASVAGSASMDITPVNDPPTTSVVALAAIAEDSGARTITQAELLANANDIENDALTATGLAISAGNGSLSNNGDGTWDYTPAADDDTSVSFSYNITDGTDSVAGSASMDITPVNDAPTTSAVTLAAIGEESGVRTITQAELLANANDAENDALTATGLAISVGSGSLVDNFDGTWSYTPAANDDTSVSFSYSITDGTDSVAGSATLDITPVNDAPTATNLNAPETYTEDTPLDFTNIAINDVDGDDVTITLTLSNPSAGQLSIGASGTAISTFAGGVWTASGPTADVNALLAGLTFTPSVNYNGNFTISVSVDDGAAAPISGLKNITGIPVGDTPIVGNTTTPASTATDLIFIDRNAADGVEVTHFRISGITNGKLYLADGVTQIHNGDFITVAQGQAGVVFAPTPNSGANGNFNVESSEDGSVVAAQSGAATSTITVLPPESLPGDDGNSDGDDGEDQTDESPTEGSDDTDEETFARLADQGDDWEDVRLGESVETAVRSYLTKVSRGLSGAAIDAINLMDMLESLSVEEAAGHQPAIAGLAQQLNARIGATFNAASKIAYQQLQNSLDQIKDEIAGKIDFNKSLLGSAIVMSTGLSVGYVLWLIRGGMLLSTLLSAMPAWQFLDPLPILAGTRDDDSDDEETLESIIKDKGHNADKLEEERDSTANVEKTEG